MKIYRDIYIHGEQHRKVNAILCSKEEFKILMQGVLNVLPYTKYGKQSGVATKMLQVVMKHIMIK